jgi:hypothetical protein
MQLTKDQTAWFETIGLALISVFLYQSGFLMMLFLVPMVMLIRRRGVELFLFAAVVALAGIFGFKLAQISRATSASFQVLALMDAAVPLLLLAGTYVMATPRLGRFRIAERLGLAVAGIGILATPLLIAAVQSGMASALEEQFQLVFRAIQGSEVGPDPAVAQRVASFAIELLLSFFVASAGIALGLNWYVGQHLARRIFGNVHTAPSLTGLKLDPGWVWVVIAGALGVLAHLTVGIGVVRFAFWNVLLFGLALYGAQGLGILFWLLHRKGIGPGGRILSAVVLIVFLFVPGLNVAVMLGVPGIGIAEIWVNFGRASNQNGA